MKKWIVILLASLFTNILSQTNVSPQFSELKGMEDQLGNTHLFYRIYSSYENYPFYNHHNDIYHFDISSIADSLFLSDYVYEDPAWTFHISVEDYKFWNSDLTKFIYGGSIGGFEPAPYIKRMDGDPIYFQALFGSVESIGISYQNDSTIFIGAYLEDFSGMPNESLKSVDGGWNWFSISDSLIVKSLNPFNENILFAFNGYGDLLKSPDGGNSFYFVDTIGNFNWEKILYDIDGDHIYRTTFKYPSHFLIVSDNQGEAFSWTTKYSSDYAIFISNDESISGTIYLAEKKNIFYSPDYGNNFNLYEALERKILGIYKKPNSNTLYAATKYKIYEITPDTLQVIKNLPIPDEVLDYYPLAVGNKWVYDEVTVVQDPYPNVYSRILIKEVLGDTITPNGKHYYKVNDETIWESSVLERVDSIEGKVYRYFEDPSLPENEYLAYDLLAEVGDTISSYRMGFNTVMFTIMYEEGMFGKWGITKPKKVFLEYTLHPPTFSLTQDVGLDSIYSYFDFGNTWTTLKGCVINGIVYGDTTTVSVNDDKTPIATTFKLEQNYPNPFNPSTTLSFVISHQSFVTLKVYDVLGNEVTTLVNEEKPAGEYEVEFNAVSHSSEVRNLTSGIYFYQLKADSYIETKKMILLK